MTTGLTVADIMTRDVVTLREEDNLTSLLPGMSWRHVRHLPVVDGDRLVGLITHRDLLRLTTSELEAAPVRAQDERLKEATFVARVMTRDVTTVRPETPALEAARVLSQNKFGCLPVVDGAGRLVGIVTEHDFLQLLVRTLRQQAPAVAAE